MSTQPHYLFLVSSARREGNAEQLAPLAAQSLPAQAQQTWLYLRDYALPPFEDLRHSGQSYAMPTGAARELLQATLEASDIVFVTPVYWYTVSTDLKRYLDEWSAWLRLPEVEFKVQMARKRFWVLASSTGSPEEAAPMFATLRLSAEFFGASVAGTLLGNGSQPGQALQNPATQEAARRFFGHE